MVYVPNPSNKQQNDIETASEDSAVKIYTFGPNDEGAIRYVEAYEDADNSDVVVKYAGSQIGNHNDK